MMKPLEETTSRRALLAMVLSSAGAMAFPINIKQEIASQGANIEAAKRFVGTWRGAAPNMPTDLPPNTNTDAILIFKMEIDRLKGTVRALGISRRNDEAPKIVRDEYVPLPDLSVEGKKLTWKEKWILPDYERLCQVTLISDDEILFEAVGTHRSSDQPTLIVPMSYKLKREK